MISQEAKLFLANLHTLFRKKTTQERGIPETQTDRHRERVREKQKTRPHREIKGRERREEKGEGRGGRGKQS